MDNDRLITRMSLRSAHRSPAAKTNPLPVSFLTERVNAVDLALGRDLPDHTGARRSVPEQVLVRPVGETHLARRIGVEVGNLTSISQGR